MEAWPAAEWSVSRFGSGKNAVLGGLAAHGSGTLATLSVVGRMDFAETVRAVHLSFWWGAAEQRQKVAQGVSHVIHTTVSSATSVGRGIRNPGSNPDSVAASQLISLFRLPAASAAG